MIRKLWEVFTAPFFMLAAPELVLCPGCELRTERCCCAAVARYAREQEVA